MNNCYCSTLALLLLALSCGVCMSAQMPGWKQYDGARFGFHYPSDFQLRELAPTDVILACEERRMKLEIALSWATPRSNEEMVLNAEKHLADFARTNRMQVTFEGWREIEGGGVYVISHLRSEGISVDVVSTARAIAGQVLLTEVMFEPGKIQEATGVGGQIFETLVLKTHGG